MTGSKLKADIKEEMKMNRKTVVIILTSFVILLAVSIGICFTLKALTAVDAETNFEVESLRWAIIGAIGGWAGSIFGAIALVISLLALWLPQRVAVKVSVGTGMLLTQIPGVDTVYAYVITVKNTGMKAITVNNIYLHFGGKKDPDIFVGLLNQNTILQAYAVTFPKRLEQGEAFEYYLLKDKLDIALKKYMENVSLDTPLSIKVDEVTKGSRYCKTKWTLAAFVGGNK